jgi:hypothetical protein
MLSRRWRIASEESLDSCLTEYTANIVVGIGITVVVIVLAIFHVEMVAAMPRRRCNYRILRNDQHRQEETEWLLATHTG